MSPPDQEKKIYAFEAPTADMARLQKLAEERKLSFSQVVRDALAGVVEAPFTGEGDLRRHVHGSKVDLAKRAAHAISGAVPGDYPTVIKKGGYYFVYWTVDGRTISGCQVYQKSFGAIRTVNITEQYRDHLPGVARTLGISKKAGFNYFRHQEITFHSSEMARIAPMIVGVYSKTLKPFSTDLRIDRTSGWEGGIYTKLFNEVYESEMAFERKVQEHRKFLQEKRASIGKEENK
jgi:hypothetical protein